MLSALLLSPPLVDELRDVLEPQDFFLMQHRAVYEALLALDAKGTRIDVVTLTHQLTADGHYTRIGGSKFLAQIFDETPAVAHIADHAQIIRQLGVLRRMGGTLRVLTMVALAAETRADVPAFLQRCEAEVSGANVATSDRETASTLRQMMTSSAAALDPAQPQPQRGVSTGLADLDELTLGLVPGELWYVAARPGQGKTALALGIAAAVAGRGQHALFFSMEMKRPELGERLLSSDSAAPYKSLQKRELSADHWVNVTHSFDRLSRLPMIIDDASVLTPSRLRSRMRRHASALRRTHPNGKLAVVVVDYVQLMSWNKPSGNRNDDLENISRELKILAGDFGVTMLACAQLSRASKDRANKRPTLTDLRGSGALEQDADKVLFVHREESDDGNERGEADLILGKGRNAPEGKVTVGWQPWCVRFTETQRGFEFGPTAYDDDNDAREW